MPINKEDWVDVRTRLPEVYPALVLVAHEVKGETRLRLTVGYRSNTGHGDWLHTVSCPHEEYPIIENPRFWAPLPAIPR